MPPPAEPKVAKVAHRIRCSMQSLSLCLLGRGGRGEGGQARVTQLHELPADS